MEETDIGVESEHVHAIRDNGELSRLLKKIDIDSYAIVADHLGIFTSSIGHFTISMNDHLAWKSENVKVCQALATSVGFDVSRPSPDFYEFRLGGFGSHRILVLCTIDQTNPLPYRSSIRQRLMKTVVAPAIRNLAHTTRSYLSGGGHYTESTRNEVTAYIFQDDWKDFCCHAHNAIHANAGEGLKAMGLERVYFLKVENGIKCSDIEGAHQKIAEQIIVRPDSENSETDLAFASRHLLLFQVHVGYEFEGDRNECLLIDFRALNRIFDDVTDHGQQSTTVYRKHLVFPYGHFNSTKPWIHNPHVTFAQAYSSYENLIRSTKPYSFLTYALFTGHYNSYRDCSSTLAQDNKSAVRTLESLRINTERRLALYRSFLEILKSKSPLRFEIVLTSTNCMPYATLFDNYLIHCLFSTKHAAINCPIMQELKTSKCIISLKSFKWPFRIHHIYDKRCSMLVRAFDCVKAWLTFNDPLSGFGGMSTEDLQRNDVYRWSVAVFNVLPDRAYLNRLNDAEIGLQFGLSGSTKKLDYTRLLGLLKRGDTIGQSVNEDNVTIGIENYKDDGYLGKNFHHFMLHEKSFVPPAFLSVIKDVLWFTDAHTAMIHEMKIALSKFIDRIKQSPWQKFDINDLEFKKLVEKHVGLFFMLLGHYSLTNFGFLEIDVAQRPESMFDGTRFRQLLERTAFGARAKLRGTISESEVTKNLTWGRASIFTMLFSRSVGLPEPYLQQGHWLTRSYGGAIRSFVRQFVEVVPAKLVGQTSEPYRWLSVVLDREPSTRSEGYSRVSGIQDDNNCVTPAFSTPLTCRPAPRFSPRIPERLIRPVSPESALPSHGTIALPWYCAESDHLVREDTPVIQNQSSFANTSGPPDTSDLAEPISRMTVSFEDDSSSNIDRSLLVANIRQESRPTTPESSSICPSERNVSSSHGWKYSAVEINDICRFVQDYFENSAVHLKRFWNDYKQKITRERQNADCYIQFVRLLRKDELPVFDEREVKVLKTRFRHAKIGRVKK